MRTFETFLGALAFAAVALTVPRALASASYPGEIQSALNMDCAPPCTVCHRDQNGGAGTATKPFAQAMIKDGDLVGQDPSLVKPALDKLEAAGSDSDGDGVTDVGELRAGTDPNVKGPSPLFCPTYGCGAHVARDQQVDPAALLLALVTALGLVALGRRRR